MTNCTQTPFLPVAQIDKDALANFKCLYYAASSYLQWHDEYNCEGDYRAVIRMNNALEMIRHNLQCLEPYV